MSERSRDLPGSQSRSLFSAVRWRDHVLGLPDDWPVSLKTVLNILFSSSESMYLVWGDERTFFFNDPYIPILGPRLERAMGARFEDVWADAYGAVEPYFSQALQGVSTRIVDMHVSMARWGEPEDTWWTFSFTPVTDDAGRVAGALCVTNETTDVVRQADAQHLADIALGESERSLRRAQEAGQIGLFTITIPSGRLTGTPEFFKLFGLPHADFIEAQAIEAMVVPEDRKFISDAGRREAQNVELQVEYRIRRPDGEIRYIERRAEFEVDDAGKPIRMVGVVQDVTERSLAREALAMLNASLEARVAERTEALKLHESIIQSDITAICAFDTGFRLIAFNQAHNDEFFRVNGFYTKIGDIFPDLFVPEQRPVMRALMARALAGESFTIEEEFGNPRINAPRWEIHYSPLRNEAGEVVGAFHHARDISARLRAQAELEVAQEALRQSQKMEAMGQLTGGVAHDFNNLLTPILGSLDLLQRRGGHSDREARLIDGALQSAERARTLVQRLLAFARRQPLQTAAVDISELLDGVTALLRSTVGPNIVVTVDIEDSLPPARADRNQLEMAILNLCVNARDAMPDGGSITIAASLDIEDREFLQLSVVDSGVGMDEETAHRAIEPFYSTKGIGKGTGLGLSMVHGLVAQLGGRLEISSEPGGGARIDLFLPVSDEGPAPVRVSVHTPTASRKGRVLVVDDEPLVRMTTADMLESFGYDIAEAADAQDAEKKLLSGETFDLVVTDHLMPGMSGAELASTIRRRWPQTPVLLISGYADAAGISPDLPRLAKPFRESELANAVTQLLGG